MESFDKTDEVPSHNTSLVDGKTNIQGDCPAHKIMIHVTNRWGSLILISLLLGTQRFSSLRNNIRGVSEKMLSQSLKLLIEDKLVERYSYPIIPPHVEYSLTPKGREAAEMVSALANWVIEHYKNEINHT